MVLRGDRQVDIALYWQTAASHINRIKKGRYAQWRSVAAAPRDDLPPPGPYTLVERRRLEKLEASDEAAAIVVSELRRLLTQYECMLSGKSVYSPPSPDMQQQTTRGSSTPCL